MFQYRSVIRRIAKIINERDGFFMFLRAQFTSQISSLTDFLVSFIFVNVFDVFYGNATLFGNISGGIVNFTLNYKWTFKSQGSKMKYLIIRFLMVWFVNLFLNREGTVLFTEFVLKEIPTENLPTIIVNNIFLAPKIIVSIIVGFVWNYNMYRLFVYKDRDYKKYMIKLGLWKGRYGIEDDNITEESTKK
ncbi:MAG: GtrA family protein [Prevotella sp.]|jgi:putative flippase GtrA|nr:GtrA family protein [Prevotella sp.]